MVADLGLAGVGMLRDSARGFGFDAGCSSIIPPLSQNYIIKIDR